ncbi:UDP-N-acetylmuramate dehydrogenase [Marinirhabdus gelatinilytica]|uniref:UDP-N-acetylenolpyruvoylglucosamine reductase n=1 Tax=Marinirhabdus gelatinilytica TaxID=1703343 RepID=A0A370Q9F9_9FLAO|nr:UDP-N-acetylmuramate dehydrogenase [Marinirhabdus gelatinilytica]RDK84680.1 UDP-N-acetylmuramate dehydrogenase [Marinirhabdus gelatinilytica]
MFVENHKSLKKYNTFGIDVEARKFVSVSSIAELKDVLASNPEEPLFLLGGGSNMLLTKDVQSLVIHLNLKGISIVGENEDTVHLKVMAGENWHNFVTYCIENNYGGIENLSLIPGNTGTAPIQNIGAYGVELKDVFVSCEAVHIVTGELKTFSKEDCKFAYRNSVFKNELKGKYIITSVAFQLTKKNHKLQTSYGAIKDQLASKDIDKPTIKDISEAVIAIRQSKLPDPKTLGNSGSFFKNPVISAEDFQQFRTQHPEAPFYEVSPTQFKIPAGWLIEQAGFKGKRFGDAGIHKNQALVLVNHGNASGAEIWELAIKIQKKVKELFGIYIEPEVNVF